MTTNILPFDDYSSIQAQAREWLIRLDRDEPPSDSERQELREWAAQSPAHQAELNRISAFWDDANILAELATPIYNQNGSVAFRLRSAIKSIASKITGKLFPESTLTFGRATMAASACLLLVLAVVLIPQPSDSTNGIYGSAIGEVQTYKLTDGSVIQLNTDSQVQVDYSDQQRKIRLLRGEAHFEVAANSQWPFDVYVGKGRVSAVGTAFSVRLNQDRVKVIVSHGRVDLAARIPPPANQQTPALPEMRTFASLAIGQSTQFKNATIDSAANPADQHSGINSIAPDQLERQLAWRSGYLVFKGDSLSHVVAEINRYTPVTIEIADPALNAVRVGGRFKVGEVEAMFEVLKTSFGVSISRVNDQLIQLYGADEPSLSDTNSSKH